MYWIHCVYVCTWMRAAALGSEELMRTGWEISILCLLLSRAVLWLTDSAENECLFLAFFFPSLLRWPEPFPLDGEAQGEGPGVQGPNEAGSELGPGTLVGVGLSISISCLAVSFNWEEKKGFESSLILNNTEWHVFVLPFLCLFSLAAFQSRSKAIVT